MDNDSDNSDHSWTMIQIIQIIQNFLRSYSLCKGFSQTLYTHTKPSSQFLNKPP